MKIKISLLLSIVVCFIVTDKVCAQTIGLSGPTTAVASGSIVTFTATGETASKHIGSVPRYAEAIYNNLLVPGITSELWDSYYYADNGVGGKFNYKLINTNTVAKTVQLSFRTSIATYATNGSLTTTVQNFSCTVTINPAPPVVGIDPAILTKINSMGFTTDAIAENDDYYLVEGDIRLLKSSLDNPSGTIYTVDNTYGQNKY